MSDKEIEQLFDEFLNYDMQQDYFYKILNIKKVYDEDDEIKNYKIKMVTDNTWEFDNVDIIIERFFEYAYKLKDYNYRNNEDITLYLEEKLSVLPKFKRKDNEEVKAKDVLEYDLEDDETEFGGVSFYGETVEDFINENNIDENITIKELNKILKDNGIKKIGI